MKAASIFPGSLAYDTNIILLNFWLLGVKKRFSRKLPHSKVFDRDFIVYFTLPE